MPGSFCFAIISTRQNGNNPTAAKYKAIWYGRDVNQINRFESSSKKCNICGYINQELTLNIREWLCPECLTKHDRDHNAAINIKKSGSGRAKEDVELLPICKTKKRQLFTEKAVCLN